VTTVAFSTEEGAFLRGQVRMEERVEITLQEEKPNSGEKNEDMKSDDQLLS
jgi:hypothetical protein